MIRLVITRALVAVALAGLAGCAVQTANTEEVGAAENAETTRHTPSLQQTPAPGQCGSSPTPWSPGPCQPPQAPPAVENNVTNGNGNMVPSNAGTGGQQSAAPAPAAH